MKEYWVKALIFILITALMILVTFSSIYAWLALSAITVHSLYNYRK